jgi:hypothetical protein
METKRIPHFWGIRFVLVFADLTCYTWEGAKEAEKEKTAEKNK